MVKSRSRASDQFNLTRDKHGSQFLALFPSPSTMNKVRPTSKLAKQMCEDVGPYQHHNISILEFVHHVWGLDYSVGQRILNMNLKPDPRALYAYRRSKCERDLCEPFIGFAKLLHGKVATRLNKKGETGMDHFWEEMETGQNLMTTWVAQKPSKDAEANLCIAKQILEIKHERYRDAGSFLSQSQKARITDTFASGPNNRSRAKTAHSRAANSERKATPNPESSESYVPPLDSCSRKRRRGSESSSDSHRPAKRGRFYERAQLLDYAIECLAATSRRWVTSLLIDTCEVTACYFDRHLVACSSSFRFDRNPSMLALVIYAMSLCDKDRAGFAPYHLPSPLSLAPPQPLQHDMTLPVAEVVGSFFDFTFGGSGDCVREGGEAEGSAVPLEEGDECEQRKDEKGKGEKGDREGKEEDDANGKENEEQNKEVEGRDRKATCLTPDADSQDTRQPRPHRSTCFRVVDFIRQPDDDLITRGTAVYKVQRRLSPGTFSDDYYALKFSWAVKNRLSEIDAIQHLLTALPESSHDHLPDLFFFQSWTAEELRMPWLDLKLSLNDENHQKRVLRVFASKYYKKLWQAGSIGNFKQAWLDCVELCYLAFRMGKVLHRDLSENNVMVLPLPDGGVKGVVNDWDMAKFVRDHQDQLLDSDHGTGTPPFMARDFLRADATRRPGYRRPTPHWLRHDLESLFYILVWAAIQYNLIQGTRDTEIHPFLKHWTKDTGRNCNSKTAFIAGGDDEEDTLVEAVKPEFQKVAEEWILPLRTLFREGQYLGTQRTKEGTTPDPSTYGGYLTFKSFMKAINVTPRTWGIPDYLEDD